MRSLPYRCWLFVVLLKSVVLVSCCDSDCCVLVLSLLFPADRPSVEKIARSFLGEFTNTLQKGQDGKWTSELSKVLPIFCRVSASCFTLFSGSFAERMTRAAAPTVAYTDVDSCWPASFTS